MLELGFSGFTSGNHIWDNREVLSILESDHRLIRPMNYPSPEGEGCPGKGHMLLKSGRQELFVINVMGRVFMDSLDCPFAAVDRALKEAPKDVPILVDFHADATSEKYAMGWHLDGRVTAIVGSHSHVQTADERILPGGSAYITDVGMTGAFDSVIGLKPQEIIKKFMTKRPQPTQAAKDNPGISCVVIKIGDRGRAQSIERLRYPIQTSDILEERDLE
jgi:metallophosphoesterase (TIGR00282 family)